jgi:hypothetical protein
MSEPVSLVHTAPDQAHLRSPLVAAASRRMALRGRDLLSVGCRGQQSLRFGHLDPAGLIRPSGWSDRPRRWLHHGGRDDDGGGRVPPQRDEDLARARATIIVLPAGPRRRWTGSWNHRLSTGPSWFCDSQASSPSFVRGRRLPALEAALNRSRRFVMASAPGRRRQLAACGCRTEGKGPPTADGGGLGADPLQQRRRRGPALPPPP